MEIMNFIVLSDKASKRRGDQKTTVTGTVFVPLETPVPVILKGTGCIGIGIVKEITMSADRTILTFTLETGVSKASLNAYYDLYRNQVTMNNNDPYDTQDAIIPGAMSKISSSGVGATTNDSYHWSDEAAKGGKRRKGGLSDFLGDIDLY